MEDLKLIREMLKHQIMKRKLESFVEESNRIENIFDSLELKLSLAKTEELLERPFMDYTDLCLFNTGGKIRELFGMNVTVGNHVPPEGGMRVVSSLNQILKEVEEGVCPYFIHQKFETLHPFTDGNGRTGRALWLWQMVNQQHYDISRGFLQEYYYQSLQHSEFR